MSIDKQKTVKKLSLVGIIGNLALTSFKMVAEAIHHDIEKNYEEVKHVMIHVNPGK